MLSRTSCLNCFATRSAVSCTSSCDSGVPVIPHAIFVMQEIPQIFIPIWFAATASHAVLIPQASAPKSAAIRTSAGLS